MLANKKVWVLTDKHIVQKLVKPKQLQNNVRHFFKYCTNQRKSEADLQPITDFKDCPLAFWIDFSFFFLYHYKQDSLFNDQEIIYQMIIFYCSKFIPKTVTLDSLFN